MRKKCLSCGAQFVLSGSGKRQRYCSKCAKRGDGRGRGLPGSNPLKAKAAKTVREQVLAQRDKPNPISFVTPHGRKGRVWLGAAGVGDDRHWRVNLKEWKRCGFTEPRKATADMIRIEGNSHVPLTRLHPNLPARDPMCVQPDIWPRPWGYKVRLYIGAEEELQQLGCGWRNVIVELDGAHVRLHHNGRIATMKRDAFKAFLARNKRPKRPQLKLSNPPKLDERFSDVA
ncbi:MAG TPA: hypothetical protein VHK26_02785 [Methyloceanibacter sp.]|nr:hypothetical protein [Methyloceanibacter sp.]